MPLAIKHPNKTRDHIVFFKTIEENIPDKVTIIFNFNLPYSLSSFSLFVKSMDKNKVPLSNAPCSSESSGSESIYVRIAREHDRTSYHVARKNFMGDVTPLYVDTGR